MTKKYTLEQLATLVDISQRTVRYYIQQELVNRPLGEKRGAYYEQGHIEQLLEIKKWQNVGLSLERIKELLVNPDEQVSVPRKAKQAGDVSVLSHIYINEGLELQVEPMKSELTPEQLRAFTKAVVSAYVDIKKDDK